MEIEPATGHTAQVAIPGARPMQAVYGPEGRLLVVEEDGDGRAALIAYALNGWRVVGRIEGVSQVRFDAAHDRVLYTRFDGNGLWASDSELSPNSVRQLSERLPSRWRYRMWSVSPSGRLAYLDGDSGCRSRLSLFDVTVSGLDPAEVTCVSKPHRSATNGFGATADAWIISTASEDGTDIGFMALPVANPSREQIAKWLLSLRKKVS